MQKRIWIPWKLLPIGLLVVFLAGWCSVLSPSVQALTEEQLSAPSAILLDGATGKVLFEKNADEQRPCASITKVMTLLLVMEALESGKLSLEQTAIASEHAASMGGSDIWLEAGEAMSVQDLIKATVIMSANDAAVVLAEEIAGSEESFVMQMNEKAKALGMTGTTFQNCNGLDEEGHLTTARDVAIMSAALIQHPQIFDYTTIWMENIRDGKTQLVNTNKLLKTYKGITGLKTGTTSKAGSCISATAERDGLSLVAVVLGCDTTAHRFSDAAALLDFGFANWQSVTPELPELTPLPVENGLSESVPLTAEAPKSILLEKGQASQLEMDVTLSESVTAPVQQGQKLGEIRYRSADGTEVAAVDVTAAASVDAIHFTACFWRLLQALLGA